MKSLLVAGRVLRTLAHVFGAWVVIRWRFPHWALQQRQAYVQRWSGRMLQVMGIELQVRGQALESGPMLMVSNHVSWLDIASLHASRYCRFVSKAGVRHWPFVGLLATGAGSLFIERESRRDAMRVVHHIAESLRSGDVVAVFPEGTTSDGSALLPFHANLLQAALTVNVPVQPVAIDYRERRSDTRSFATAFVGDDTLMGSLWKVLSAPPLTVVVSFGTPQLGLGRDRRRWAADLQQEVQALRTASDTSRPG